MEIHKFYIFGYHDVFVCCLKYRKMIKWRKKPPLLLCSMTCKMILCTNWLRFYCRQQEIFNNKSIFTRIAFLYSKNYFKSNMLCRWLGEFLYYWTYSTHKDLSTNRICNRKFEVYKKVFNCTFILHYGNGFL